MKIVPWREKMTLWDIKPYRVYRFNLKDAMLSKGESHQYRG